MDHLNSERRASEQEKKKGDYKIEQDKKSLIKDIKSIPKDEFVKIVTTVGEVKPSLFERFKMAIRKFFNNF